MKISRITTALALTAGLILSTGAGCADLQAPESEAPTTDGIDINAAELGSILPSCSTSGSSGYDAETKTLSLELTALVSKVVVAVPHKKIAVNHNPCVDSAGVDLTTTSVKKIVITGTTGDDEVVLDFAQGPFGAILSTQGGITIDLDAGTADVFAVRGSAGTDKFSVGSAGGDHFFELSGDKVADVVVQNAEAFTVSLGEGNDTFTGLGGAISATHLVDGVTSLAAATADLVIYGGAGNDTLTGGAGDDELYGGEGNDTFKTDVADDGSDAYDGGEGVDTMDYSSRTGDLTVTLDDTGNDGEAGEADDVQTTVENVTGGEGDDTLTGSDASNTLKGGDGDDTLNGGVAASDCDAVSPNTLEGGNGDDTFDMGSAANCGDVLVGGADSDTVDYSGRTNAVTITVNNQADDGETGEEDNVKTDVEQLIGGDGDDTITGGPGDEIITGGPGADTLSGNAGDDTFVMGSAASGADILNGGTGHDTVDYSARVAALTVTLCVATTATTGDSADCAADDGLVGEGQKILNVEHVLGGSGDDSLTGAESDDTLEGRDGADTLNGGDGNDNLFGDDGVDALNGDAGDDYLDGGDGDDVLAGGAGDGDICVNEGGGSKATCEL